MIFSKNLGSILFVSRREYLINHSYLFIILGIVSSNLV